MDQYKETLEAMIAKTKAKQSKKKITAEERAEFCKTWIQLVKEDGFSLNAEDLLYRGGALCGATPFFEYLNQAEDPSAVLDTLFKGRFYGKDCASTFRLMTHLFVLLLNHDAPQSLLSPMIKKLPKACLNKEEKRFGLAGKMFGRYFLAELKQGIELRPLADVPVKPAYIREFVELVLFLLDDIEKDETAKKGARVLANAEKTRAWAMAYGVTAQGGEAPTVAVKKEEDKPTVLQPATADKPQPPKEGQAEKELPALTPAVSQRPMPEDAIDHLFKLLGKVEREAYAIKDEIGRKTERIAALTRELERTKEAQRAAEQQIAAQKERIEKLIQDVIDAERQRDELKETVKQKEAIIAEKEADIEQRKELADVLSRDRAKQGDELLQRLASEIRKVCAEVDEARGMEMSGELGVFYKDTLNAVLNALEKNGIKIR